MACNPAFGRMLTENLIYQTGYAKLSERNLLNKWEFCKNYWSSTSDYMVAIGSFQRQQSWQIQANNFENSMKRKVIQLRKFPFNLASNQLDQHCVTGGVRERERDGKKYHLWTWYLCHRIYSLLFNQIIVHWMLKCNVTWVCWYVRALKIEFIILITHSCH